ncbi:MAG: hypothetical protein AABW86_00935 [Candidatus Micrarchaeota archaeon]
MSGPSVVRQLRPQVSENVSRVVVVSGFFEKASHLPGGKMPYPYTFVASFTPETGVRVTRHFGNNNGVAVGQKSFSDPNTQREMLLARLHEIVMPFGDQKAIEVHSRETDPKKQLLRPSQLSHLSLEELEHIRSGLSEQGNVPRQVTEAISSVISEKDSLRSEAPLIEGLRVAASG